MSCWLPDAKRKRVTDYLLQQHKELFEPLARGNRAPHANSEKIGKNCMWYCINLRQFSKRALISFGAVEKVIFMKCVDKSKQAPLLTSESYFREA